LNNDLIVNLTELPLILRCRADLHDGQRLADVVVF
jgi:hypothetical protein